MTEKEEVVEKQDLSSEALVDSVRVFLDEDVGLDLKSAYFVCKQATEDYWADIQAEEEGEDEGGLLPVEEEGDMSEEEVPEEPESFEEEVEKVLPDLEPPKPPSTPELEEKVKEKLGTHDKQRIFLKKPRISTGRKPNRPEEWEE